MAEIHMNLAEPYWMVHSTRTKVVRLNAGQSILRVYVFFQGSLLLLRLECCGVTVLAFSRGEDPARLTVCIIK